jgi:hypothetical protein
MKAARETLDLPTMPHSYTTRTYQGELENARQPDWLTSPNDTVSVDVIDRNMGQAIIYIPIKDGTETL